MELAVDQRAGTGKSTAAEMSHVEPLSRALKSDLEEVHQIELEIYGDDAYSHVVLRQFLDMYGELFQVYRDADGHVIGYGVIAPSINEGSGWFLSLAVSLPHRRKGIGTALVNRLLDKAAQNSLTELFLTVAPANHAAVSVYERSGFVAMKIEPDYYGPNEDRIIMRRG